MEEKEQDRTDRADRKEKYKMNDVEFRLVTTANRIVGSDKYDKLDAVLILDMLRDYSDKIDSDFLISVPSIFYLYIHDHMLNNFLHKAVISLTDPKFANFFEHLTDNNSELWNDVNMYRFTPLHYALSHLTNPAFLTMYLKLIKYTNLWNSSRYANNFNGYEKYHNLSNGAEDPLNTAFVEDRSDDESDNESGEYDERYDDNYHDDARSDSSYERYQLHGPNDIDFAGGGEDGGLLGGNVQHVINKKRINKKRISKNQNKKRIMKNQTGGTIQTIKKDAISKHINNLAEWGYYNENTESSKYNVFHKELIQHANSDNNCMFMAISNLGNAHFVKLFMEMAEEDSIWMMMDDNNFTPLHLAAIKFTDPQYHDFFIRFAELPGMWQYINIYGYCPLMYLIDNGDIELLLKLADYRDVWDISKSIIINNNNFISGIEQIFMAVSYGNMQYFPVLKKIIKYHDLLNNDFIPNLLNKPHMYNIALAKLADVSNYEGVDISEKQTVHFSFWKQLFLNINVQNLSEQVVLELSKY